MFDVFAPEHLKGKYKERTAWAIDQMQKAGKASNRLGFKSTCNFFRFITLANDASLATATQRAW